MSAMECNICGIACSKIIVDLTERNYIRLCKDCYEEIKDKRISDFVDEESLKELDSDNPWSW